MNLYILRHASAGTRRPNPVIDAKRPIDKEGKEQCLIVGNYLNSQKVQFDLIVSSPLKRALQTASLVGTEVAYDAKIQVTDALAPAASVESFRQLVEQLSNRENVLLVGHNPNLPRFVEALISSSTRVNIRLRKGSLARVDCSSRPGQLLSLVDPKLLRQIYSSVTKSSRRKTSRK